MENKSKKFLTIKTEIILIQFIAECQSHDLINTTGHVDVFILTFNKIQYGE